MAELQAELAVARAELAEARAEIAAASDTLASSPPLPTLPADVVIHDITDDDDEDDDIPYGLEQYVRIALFESLYGDTDHRHALAVEAQARSHALAMSLAYLCSNLDPSLEGEWSTSRVDPENLGNNHCFIIRYR
jgi:hypothetical protein